MPYYIDEDGLLAFRNTVPGTKEPPEDPEVRRLLLERWGIVNEEIQAAPIIPITNQHQDTGVVLEDDDDNDNEQIPRPDQGIMAYPAFQTIQAKVPEMKTLSKAEEKAKNAGIKLQGFRQGAEHGRYGGALYSDSQRRGCFTGSDEEKAIFSEGFKMGYEAAAKPKEEPLKTLTRHKKTSIKPIKHNWKGPKLTTEME